MSAKKRAARASEAPCERGVSRRVFVAGVATLLVAPWSRADEREPRLPAQRVLETSRYVYVSPLRSDGSESTCHGEVWFAWLDGAAVVTTATSTWKVRAVARGLDRARVWIGDHGRWKRMLGRNEAFREAPQFEARARAFQDPELLDRLLANYEKKYPKEIGRWAPRMRAGHANGTRILIAYEPV